MRQIPTTLPLPQHVTPLSDALESLLVLLHSQKNKNWGSFFLLHLSTSKLRPSMQLRREDHYSKLFHNLVFYAMPSKHCEYQKASRRLQRSVSYSSNSPLMHQRQLPAGLETVTTYLLTMEQMLKRWLRHCELHTTFLYRLFHDLIFACEIYSAAFLTFLKDVSSSQTVIDILKNVTTDPSLSWAMEQLPRPQFLFTYGWSQL